MECPLWRLLISSRSVSKHGHHMQFLFPIGRFLKKFLLWNCLAIWTETWEEASTCMEGSVLSFPKAEWKVSDTVSAHWASSIIYFNYSRNYIKYWLWIIFFYCMHEDYTQLEETGPGIQFFPKSLCALWTQSNFLSGDFLCQKRVHIN